MTYKALYRTYRPQVFEEVVGQKYVLQTLKNAINEQRIAHAYLFSGPRGTGKTSIAKLLAKGVNCNNSHSKPCGICDSCLAIAEGSHPDVVEIDAASNNGVDEIRDLIDKVKYAPAQGKYKVYIIDEVHMLSLGAFNALLKTLEEPPKHVVFILATTEVHKVLPTIVSRCQRFDFGRVSQTDIEGRVKNVLVNENLEYESNVIPLIASLADGSVRDALGILDQALAYTNSSISLQDIRDIFGIATEEEILDFVNIIRAQDVKQSLAFIDEFDIKGVDLIRLTSMLIEAYKNIVIYNKTKTLSDSLLLSESSLKTLSSNINSDLAFKYIDILVEALTNYKKINIPKSFFELAILKMCNLNGNVEDLRVNQNVPTYSTPTKIIKEEVIQKEDKPTIEESITQTQEDDINEVSSILSKEELKEEMPSFDTKEEAIIKEEMPKTIIGEYFYTEGEIINILRQSKKEAKTDLLTKWRLIKNYQIKPAFAKAANLIIDSTPYAVSEKAIIFYFKEEPQANLMNESQNQQSLQALMFELTNTNPYCYGISENYANHLKHVFIDARNRKTFPEITEIEAPTLKEKKVIEIKEETSETLETGKSLFGDLLEVVED